MPKNFRSLVLVLCFALSSCSSNPPTFITYTQQKSKTGGAFDPRKFPKPTDALALNYANMIEVMFRAKANGARIAGEGSDTGLAVLSAAIAGAEALGIGAAGVSSLGLASGGIVALRTIVDAKGHSLAFSEAGQRIHAAIKDYVAHNLNDVSGKFITANGWTLVNVVQSNIDIMNRILNGHLPKPQALAQASEAMSVAGATEPMRGAPPTNNIPASSLTRAVAGIQKQTGVPTTGSVRVEPDKEYLERVRDLKRRVNNLSDAEAIAVVKKMLGWDSPDGKTARFDIIEALDKLKDTRIPARVSDWERILSSVH